MSNPITIKGSAKIITEFFAYGVNSILYQRGIYPAEQFERKQKYGLTLLCTSDKELKAYITSFLNQLNGWLHRKTVQKVVVCVTDTITGEVCEKWQFNVECDKDQTADSNKTEKQINKEIQAVLRQITSTVSFLPLIENQCAFDLQAYTDNDAEVPEAWQVSDEKSVENAAELAFREISTGHHTVKSGVTYRGDAD